MIYKAQVRYCIELAEGIFELSLLFPNPEIFQPGQFISLQPTPGHFMARPFSVACVTTAKWAESLSIIFKVVGENTRAYSKLQRGDSIAFYGPKGRPILFDGRKYILVAGGMGIGGIHYLAQKLIEEGNPPLILYGTKRVSEMFDLHFNCQVVQVIEEKDDMLVTDLLEERLKSDNGNSVVVACGPSAMLAEVAYLTAGYKNECRVIVEEMMACGSGSCKSCAVFMVGGLPPKLVCHDGPSFKAEEVDWDKMPYPFPAYTFVDRHPDIVIDDPMEIVLHGQDGRTLTLKTPLMTASGCFDGTKDKDLDISKVGAIVAKGIYEDERSGNDCHRMEEVAPYGARNAIGLSGEGICNFKKKSLPILFELGKPVIANVCGNTVEEYSRLSEQLNDTPIAAQEANVGCTTVKKGGMAFGTEPKDVAKIIRGMRKKAPQQFLFLKLTPFVGPRMLEMIRAAIDEGADGVVIANTMPSFNLDPRTHRPTLGSPGGGGGYSGPGIFPYILYLVKTAYEADLRIPIVAVGGIDNSVSAEKMIITGASAVQIGTASLRNKSIFTEVDEFLRQEMKKKGVPWIGDLVGTLVL